MMNFEERAQNFEYKLNDTDDQIIEYILAHKQDVIYLSIQQLAAEFYTVPNTITRFTKKMGYDGFSHMKSSLKEEVIAHEVTAEDKVTYNIKKTMDLLDPDHLKTIAKLLQDTHRILFFAVGDTAHLCDMMVKSLKAVNKQAEHYIHRHDAIHEINQLNKTDIVFFISLTGETSQVLDLANLAKERGVKVLSLTHFNLNSLQKMADIKLYCYSPRTVINDYSVTDKTPAMMVLRALAETYWEMEK